MKVTINGRELDIDQAEATADEVVQLARGEPCRPGITITYRYADRTRAGSTLCCDEKMQIEDGMIINVFDTSAA